MGLSPLFWPTEPLAYFEWYTAIKPTAEPNHNMYSTKPLYRSDGSPAGSIVPLTSIRQSCMLFPVFGKVGDGNGAKLLLIMFWTHVHPSS
jgi:hypothetical protein